MGKLLIGVLAVAGIGIGVYLYANRAQPMVGQPGGTAGAPQAPYGGGGPPTTDQTGHDWAQGTTAVVGLVAAIVGKIGGR